MIFRWNMGSTLGNIETYADQYCCYPQQVDYTVVPPACIILILFHFSLVKNKVPIGLSACWELAAKYPYVESASPSRSKLFTDTHWWVKAQYWWHMAVCPNLVPLVNIKIAGKWMFIPLKIVLIGIDPYPYPTAFSLDQVSPSSLFLTPWNTSARAIAQQKSTVTNIDVVVISIYIWLVVSTPLKNMKVKWDYCSQYMDSHKKCLKPPTIYIYTPLYTLWIFNIAMENCLFYRWFTY